MGNAVEVLGWIMAAGILGALSNHLLKLVSRTFLKGISREREGFMKVYRGLMKFMVRRHRYFGLAALAILPVHAGLVILGSALSLTGAAAALALIATASLGAYGFYVRKDLRAGWLPVHRALAFVLLLAAVVHVYFKGFVSL
ncbi:MAG TPA: hypothetical protein PKM41_06200 [Deltaproteobacteria bacterium]|jgi:hypothetical protein|nr:hypothetical protein [Deltaproteobacteria bacterium]HOI08048.1 hypothetical protein [Deltaproteobacteria bacterium]